jgi:hypothetical protein
MIQASMSLGGWGRADPLGDARLLLVLRVLARLHHHVVPGAGDSSVNIKALGL